MTLGTDNQVWVVWYQNLPGQILGVFTSEEQAVAAVDNDWGHWTVTTITLDEVHDR